MKYTSWLAQHSPKDGVEVFICSPRAKDMNPDEVLRQLENFSNRVIQLYLEYLVTNLKSENSEYYTRLACSYIDDIYEAIKTHKGLEIIKELVDEFKNKVTPYPLIEESTAHVTFVGYLSTQKNHTSFVHQRLLLINFLLRSSLYNPETVMEALIKAGPLDIEKCIVYGRMGNHEESLNILVHDLSDFVGAETYCVSNGSCVGEVPTNTPTRSSSLSEKRLLLAEDESIEDIEEKCVLFSSLFDIYRNINDR
ncbi:hypothetical protein BY458DRAFT_432090 [Sporodiniella umbellata]|nr:hypothetical protein BY458DRAFT_432090 [Sporodiniella umbellata]